MISRSDVFSEHVTSLIDNIVGNKVTPRTCTNTNQNDNGDHVWSEG